VLRVTAACGRTVAETSRIGHAARVRPLLVPGTHLLRRGDGSVQLGLDPATATVLPDEPEVRRCLDVLTGQAAAVDGERGQDLLLTRLREAEALVEESVLRPLIGADGSERLPRETGAALVRTAGASAGEAAAARARTRVHVERFGHPSGAPLVDDLVALLRRAGLRTRRPRRDHVRGAAPIVGVLVGVGEPNRELLDGWMREGIPFLLVRLTEGRATVGPFVEPGLTACLRCVDAHHTDADPAWPLLVQQYARASSRDRADGTPEPVDPSQAAVALAWAARDLVSYADGMCPSTWSATMTLEALLVRMRTRRWLRHPDCGCWWDATSRGSA
jgi:bacteriocin biosynthesis cyclodehydratase domain-containing protein